MKLQDANDTIEKNILWCYLFVIGSDPRKQDQLLDHIDDLQLIYQDLRQMTAESFKFK